MQGHARLREDLCRMAKFGANLADAHSCFIFLPTESLTEIAKPEKDALMLVGFHSLSSNVIENRVIPGGYGLIGWVSKNHRSIHVSPFERDSRTLGVYGGDQELKSFIGIPITLPSVDGLERGHSGVIACDSKKAYAFSKLQGKLLENLALEISNLLELHDRIAMSEAVNSSWESFKSHALQLAKALGPQAVEVLRLQPANFEAIEGLIGMERATCIFDQICRLIRQTLPPHFPMFRSASGDIIIMLDNMMTSFFANKIEALCRHLSGRGERLLFSVTRASFTQRKSDALDLEQLVADTLPSGEITKGRNYEHRRA